MDALALASALDNLEKSWSALDAWLKFWIALVVVGVTIEIFVVIIEYAHDLRDFRRATIHSPGRPSRSKFFFEMLGAALVAIGVAGEFGIHIQAGKIETDMRDKTRQLVAIADAEAGGANERASKANERAANLEKENLKLEALIQPRSLTVQQQREIGSSLATLTVSRLQVGSFFSDPESYHFCEQIRAALKFARFESADGCGAGPVNRGDAKRVGIYIESWREDEVAGAIARALRTTGKVSPVSVADIPYSSDTMPFLSMLVATKPLPK
jgi:hypothetical protein